MPTVRQPAVQASPIAAVNWHLRSHENAVALDIAASAYLINVELTLVKRAVLRAKVQPVLIHNPAYSALALHKGVLINDCAWLIVVGGCGLNELKRDYWATRLT